MFGRSRWVGGGAHKNSRLLQFTFSWEWLRSNNPCLTKAGENCQHVALPKSEMFVKVLFFFFMEVATQSLKRLKIRSHPNGLPGLRSVLFVWISGGRRYKTIIHPVPSSGICLPSLSPLSFFRSIYVYMHHKTTAKSCSLQK